MKRAQFPLDREALLQCRSDIQDAIKLLQQYLDSCPRKVSNAASDLVIASYDEAQSDHDEVHVEDAPSSSGSGRLIEDNYPFMVLPEPTEGIASTLAIRRVATWTSSRSEEFHKHNLDFSPTKTSREAKIAPQNLPSQAEHLEYASYSSQSRDRSDAAHSSHTLPRIREIRSNISASQSQISGIWKSENLPNLDNWKSHENTGSQQPHCLIEVDKVERTEFTELLKSFPPYETLKQIVAENTVQLRAKMTLEEWLVRGVWYFLKARESYPTAEMLEVILSEQINGRRRSSRGWRASALQALVDFCKSCYIVNDIAFVEDSLHQPLPTSTWKMGLELISGLQDMIEHYHEIAYPQTTQLDLLMQRGLDLSFSEKMYQPIEFPSKWPDGLDTHTSSNRWLSVEMKNAGFENERVYFRTFVNAEVAKVRSEQRASKREPYVLLLWSQRGRSEMAVTLINQAGTLHLTTVLTTEDLEQGDRMHSPTEFLINFPSQGRGGANVHFQSTETKDEFLNLPRNFLASMDKREPRAGEFLMFRGSLEYFHCRNTFNTHRHGSVSREPADGESAANPHSSCEISLFEMIPNECWKTVRRLVISSSPDEACPWSISYWLPLAQVQVHFEDRMVEISWSDCANLEKKSTGEYSHTYSYVYDPQHPNQSVSAQFEFNDHATQFVNYVLFPFETPIELPNMRPERPFGVVSSTRETRVWEIRDLDEKHQEKYMAIVHVDKLPNYKLMTEIYFVHRDLDFTFTGSSGLTIELECIHTPHYISNMRRLANELRPGRDPTPVCQDIVWRSERATFGFASYEDLDRFMKSLTGWQMRYHWTAPRVKIFRGKLGSTVRANASISLWQRHVTSLGSVLTLAVRCIEKGHVEWRTATLSHASQIKMEKVATRILIQHLHLQEGSQIDGSTFTAQKRAPGLVYSGKGTHTDARDNALPQYSMTINMPDARAGEEMYNILHQALIYNGSSALGSVFQHRSSASALSGSESRRNVFHWFK